jgi:heme-degrading monooxygenase HmoA
MEVVLFQIHTRSDVDEAAYNSAFEEMLEHVSTIPGFVGIEGFSGEDGSELAVAWFESEEAIARWREHPRHVQTRRRGKEEFFESYQITVATVSRRYGWKLESTE